MVHTFFFTRIEYMKRTKSRVKSKSRRIRKNRTRRNRRKMMGGGDFIKDTQGNYFFDSGQQGLIPLKKKVLDDKSVVFSYIDAEGHQKFVDATSINI
jgi:hypothetical protein